jgi:hypothetical protein
MSTYTCVHNVQYFGAVIGKRVKALRSGIQLITMIMTPVYARVSDHY